MNSTVDPKDVASGGYQLQWSWLRGPLQRELGAVHLQACHNASIKIAYFSHPAMLPLSVSYVAACLTRSQLLESIINGLLITIFQYLFSK